MVRPATLDDLDFLDQHDGHLTRAVLADKLERGEVYVAESEGRLVGWARYNLIWDTEPFLTLIYLLESHRRQGLGTELMRYWEEQMRGQGHRLLFTSTQADESAQFFYRKLGFSDTGVILFPGQAAAELVLVKRLEAEPSGLTPGPGRRLPP